MRPNDSLIDAVLGDAMLTLDELCRAAAVDAQWLHQRVADGLLHPAAGATGERGAWRFDVPALRRVRCMVRVERGFDAAPELAALVADLEAEIERLRGQLARGRLR